MKSSFMTLLLASFFLFLSCTSEKQPEPELQEVSFHVSGMYCDGCVKAITVELQRIEGLSGVKVTLKDSLVVFNAAEENIPSKEKLSALMEELGYEAIFED